MLLRPCQVSTTASFGGFHASIERRGGPCGLNFPKSVYISAASSRSQNLFWSLLLFAGVKQTKLQQDSYRKTQKQREITTKSFWIPAPSSQHNTLRRRAASAPPLNLGLGGTPQETGSRRSSVPRNLHPAPRSIAGLGNFIDRKSTRLNSSHITRSRMPSSA